MGLEVGVVGERGGKLGGSIDDIEGHGIVEQIGPLGWAVRLHDCTPVGIVAGDVVRQAWQVGGQLVGIRRAIGRWCCDVTERALDGHIDTAQVGRDVIQGFGDIVL